MATGQRNLAVIKILTALAMMLFLAAFSQTRESAAAGLKGNDMQVSEHIGPGGVSRPPIDLKTPAEFATATFGLG